MTGGDETRVAWRAVPAELPANEEARLLELESYALLDTIEEQSFDDMTRLAAYICQTPISLVSLVDRDRQWFKSRHGLAASETPREVAFCAHAIHGDEVFFVEDALEDDRFRHNPLVRDDPKIRFYAGAPLKTPSNFRVGTLCVIDREPRSLDENQQAMLRALSRQVVSLMELRKRNIEQQASLDTKALRLEQASAELKTLWG